MESIPKVKFKIGMLQSVRGIVRFYLRQIEPVLELFVSPINFDPSTPLFPISSPPEYARELKPVWESTIRVECLRNMMV